MSPPAAAAPSSAEANPGASLGDAEAALERRDYATARRLFQTAGRPDAAEAIDKALAALDRKDYASADELFEALTPLKGSAGAEGAKASKSRGDDQQKPAPPPPVDIVPFVEPDDRRPPLLSEPAKTRRRKPLVIAAGLALLALLGVSALYVRQSGGTVAGAGERRPRRSPRAATSPRGLRSRIAARLQATAGAPRRTISARR